MRSRHFALRLCITYVCASRRLCIKAIVDCIVFAHMIPWASEGFFQAGGSREFNQNFFQGGPKVVKFGFTPRN